MDVNGDDFQLKMMIKKLKKELNDFKIIAEEMTNCKMNLWTSNVELTSQNNNLIAKSEEYETEIKEMQSKFNMLQLQAKILSDEGFEKKFLHEQQCKELMEKNEKLEEKLAEKEKLEEQLEDKNKTMENIIAEREKELAFYKKRSEKLEKAKSYKVKKFNQNSSFASSNGNF